MRRSVFGLAVLALVLPGDAPAHDFWIEPSTFRPEPGSNVAASLRVGQKLQGDPVPAIPALIERCILKSKSGESEVAPDWGADPAGYVRVPEPGLQWIGYQSNSSPVALEAGKFEEYLKDEGLERIVASRAAKGQSAAPGRERFYRCAKSLLDAPGGKRADGSAVLDAPLGFTLELVPRKSPYAASYKGELPLAVLFRGKPVANVLVVAMSKDDPGGAVSARTNTQGLVTLRVARPGFWIVKAVHMEAAPPDAGVDWESWWASLTFDLPSAPGK